MSAFFTLFRNSLGLSFLQNHKFFAGKEIITKSINDDEDGSGGGDAVLYLLQ